MGNISYWIRYSRIIVGRRCRSGEKVSGFRVEWERDENAAGCLLIILPDV